MVTPPSSVIFKNNLLRLMKSSGMTITQCAKRAGLLPQNFSKYLKGQLVPNLTTLDKLAKALEVPPCELVDQNTGLARFPRQEILEGFNEAIKKFVIFRDLTPEESQELSLLVDRFGGWSQLLPFLREEYALRQRGEEYYQKTKAEITQNLSSRGIKEAE